MTDNKDEVKDFLMSRRAKVTPEQAGLESFGERRVPGLRREEVAVLAGVSLEYYTRLERGNIHGASESVVGAVASALHLNDVEREYLFDLARTAPKLGKKRPAPAPNGVRVSVQRVLDNMATPAIVHNANQDLVAANLIGRALYAPIFDSSDRPNIARFVFLDPRAQTFYRDWALARRTVAATIRLEAGRNPLNADLTALIGELSTRSPRFRNDWVRQDVHEHRSGVKSFQHPDVGVVEAAFDVFEMPGQDGLQIVTYSAPPGTATAEKFEMLASWFSPERDATDGAPSVERAPQDGLR
ncbi:helix-turn-helix domain-containing protein [Microbacterium sp. ISL-103]|uniref:helix-turn-helix transcriptional regulator n=1 Tax=Microbacterium sp. ISL-103 TaxID=2819156 RepID=UPI001BE97240|nr:helix-turn-helix transcriptional regulator [Microbacterium sp. ISL-103]MBT2475805.1 helix-turn-helix domain-containing protein [Microbacterium sp. ISL-103]